MTDILTTILFFPRHSDVWRNCADKPTPPSVQCLTVGAPPKGPARLFKWNPYRRTQASSLLGRV